MMLVLVVLNFHAEIFLSNNSSISSSVRPLSSGRNRKKKMPQAKFDPAQMYPYLAPFADCQPLSSFPPAKMKAKRNIHTQFMFSGLIKYGEQNPVSQARKYPKLMADPTVHDLSRVLTNSVATG